MGLNLYTKLEKHVLGNFVVDKFKGIKICNFKKEEDDYKRTIIESLKLVKKLDIRRFKTIQNEVSWIVNTNLVEKYSGMYIRKNKACEINFHRYCEDSKLVSAYYAGVIVHEATHGYLRSKGFEYKPENRLQIERICTAEENRFYMKVESIFREYQGLLFREFDPKNWNYAWNASRYKKFYDRLKRILQNH